MSGLLDGIRVLDLSRLLPGGFGTGLLADLGAEVIKVEQPVVGDYMRWLDPKLGDESAASWVVDRGKRSIGVDLKSPRGVEVVRRLVRSADAFVESFRPGVADRLGVGYEALRAERPDLVYCSISGYGQTGPLRTEAGHDLNYIGRAGLLSITGSHDGRPGIPGVQVADLGGGALLAMVGLLAALVRAARTGEGEHIDMSMTDGAFALLSVHLGDYFATGVVPERERMLLNGGYPSYNVYACADGKHLTVGALEEKFFAVVCEVVGRPDLALDGSRPGGAARLAGALPDPDEGRVARDLRRSRGVRGACQRLRRGQRRPAAAPPRDGRRGGASDRGDGAPGRASVQAARASCRDRRPAAAPR